MLFWRAKNGWFVKISLALLSLTLQVSRFLYHLALIQLPIFCTLRLTSQVHLFILLKDFLHKAIVLVAFCSFFLLSLFLWLFFLSISTFPFPVSAFPFPVSACLSFLFLQLFQVFAVEGIYMYLLMMTMKTSLFYTSFCHFSPLSAAAQKAALLKLVWQMTEVFFVMGQRSMIWLCDPGQLTTLEVPVVNACSFLLQCVVATAKW